MDNRLFTLYINYLTGRCTWQEFLELKEWLSSSNDEQVGETLHKSWELGLELPAMNAETKNRIKANLQTATRFDTGKPRRKISWAAVAAVAIIVILSGSLVYVLNSKPQIYTAPFVVNIEKGQRATMALPDMSHVHLNAGTTLEYDLSDRDNRRVNLNGEAYFQVKRDEKHPFIVEMNDLQINVLGTSFNVRTYPDEDYIQVSLVEGSIKLKSKKSDTWQYLKPEQQLVYSKKSGVSKVVSFDSDVELAWMDERLVFNSEPLHKIIRRIERWYGVQIDLQCPEIREDRMTGTFDNEELGDVLHAISLQYKVQYTMNGRSIIISKNH